MLLIMTDAIANHGRALHDIGGLFLVVIPRDAMHRGQVGEGRREVAIRAQVALRRELRDARADNERVEVGAEAAAVKPLRGRGEADVERVG